MTLRSLSPLSYVITAVIGLPGCDQDPIYIGPEMPAPDQFVDRPGAGGSGGTGGEIPEPPVDQGPGGSGGAGGQGGGMVEPMPDPALFNETVVTVLYGACGGPACHVSPSLGPNPDDALFRLVDAAPDALDPDQQTLNFHEVLSFVSFDAPTDSPLLVWHPQGHQGYIIPQSATYNRILEWIEDAIAPPEPEGAGGMGGVGGMGGGQVPCEGIPPPGSPGGRSQGYRDAFEAEVDGESINDMLVESCGEQGACHGTQGAAGGYWLLADLEDPCAIQWNYLVSQWFIDPLLPDASLLLSKPRERNHGGAVVFRGRDDARHVRLLLWIENEFIR